MSKADVSHRIILTGASGMLGKAILEELARHPAAQVLALYRNKIPRATGNNIRHETCDLELDESIAKIVGDFAPTIFIHSAATGMQSPLPDPEALNQANVQLPVRLATAVPIDTHFVHLSSGLAYTDQGRPLREDDPLGTKHPYGASKVEAERRLLEVTNDRKIPLTIVRPFSFTGKGDFGTRLFPSLLRNAESGMPFKMSSGEQVRDHANVRDIARGVMAAAFSSPTAAAPRIFNLGSGDCRPLREVVLDVSQQLDIPVQIEFGARPLSPNEPMFMVADTTWAQNELGWKAQENLAYAVWELSRSSFPGLRTKQPARHQ